MIPTPQPPTDNLYKFIAIAGLLLVVVSIFGPARAAQDIMQRRAELAANIGRLEARQRVLDHNIDDLKGEVVVLKAEAKELAEGPQSRAMTPAERRQADGMLDSGVKAKQRLRELVRELADFEGKRAELAAKSNYSAWLEARHSFLSRLSFGLMAVGVVLAYVGFQLWYRRVQVFQDRALKAQVLKAQAEADSSE